MEEPTTHRVTSQKKLESVSCFCFWTFILSKIEKGKEMLGKGNRCFFEKSDLELIDVVNEFWKKNVLA
jgi:hypothetical protein